MYFSSRGKPGLGTNIAILTAVFAAWLGSPMARPADAAGGKLEISVIDRDTGQPIACRMHLKNKAGRPRKVRGLPFWNDHFVFSGTTVLDLPVGDYTFLIERGLEYVHREGHFRIDNFAADARQIDLTRFINMSEHGWWSGDLEVRRRVDDIELLMEADDLHVAQVITWANDEDSWNSGRIPEDLLVRFGKDRYYHLMAGAHARGGSTLLLFNLPKPLAWSGDGEYPPSIRAAEAARRQDGGWVDLSKPFWWDLPMLVANGQVDSIQLAHSHLGRDAAITHEADGKPRNKTLYPNPRGNARWSQQIYFHLLECGLRIPPSAGSGSGESPNPVGYNRAYVHVGGTFNYRDWWENLRAGRVVVTNGPLLLPSVHGRMPGHVFQAKQGEEIEFEIGLTLSTREPISYLEIVKNGRVEHSIRYEKYAESGRLPKLPFDGSGWFLVRAVTDQPKTYRFAMTGPYFVEFDGQRRISKASAEFFLNWVYERARQIKLTDAAEHAEVMKYHRQARDFWQDLVSRANAP